MKLEKRLALGFLVLALSLTAVELGLHLFPALLPRAYLAGFPAHGCEFFHPDVFERTPVEGVLLPHLANAYRGVPPADLVELGVAPATNDDDARAFPEVEVPADALGFPNPDGHADGALVLLGDSFGVSAGVRHPEGLQAALERVTGLGVLNLSLAGIGPVQERWLLETRALPARPRAVVWLWYSGNDLTASYEPFLARRDGKKTWAEAWPERGKPRLILLDLVRHALRGGAAPARAPLPPFELPDAEGRAQAVWFLPDNLRQLGWARADWEAYPVWAPVAGELRAARDACAVAGVPLLLVYLPSKAEMLLPRVAPDAALVERTTAWPEEPLVGGDAPALLERLLANRHAQEELLRDFCGRERIPFLSAVPALEAQAARGELGYLVTDTHWQSRGQQALLEPLLASLRAAGVVP